jgi:hypothetical protein
MANNLSSPQDLSGSAWRLSNATLSLNSATAPDGTTTADKLQETTATAQHFIMQDNPMPSTSGATRQRAWCFYHPVERPRLFFECDDSTFASGGVFATFDCSGSGAVLTADNLRTGVWGTGITLVSTAIQALTGTYAGWYYCKVVFDTTYSTMAPYWILDNGSGTAAPSLSYAGTAGNGGHLWETGLNPDTTADPYTAILTGGVTVSGAQTLARPTNASTIAVIDAVTGAQTLAGPTNANAFKPIVAVTGSQALGLPSQSGAVGVVDTVTGAQTLAALSQAGTISVTNNRTINGAQTLAALTQANSFGVVDAVTGAQTLARPSQTGAVSAPASVVGNQVIAALSQAGTINVVPFTRTITGAQTVAQPSQANAFKALVGVTGAQLLPALAQSGSITPIVTGAITITGAQVLDPLLQHMDTYFYPWQGRGEPGAIWIPKEPVGSVWTPVRRPGSV